MQRSVVLSDGWDIMDFVKQLQKLAAGNVAFATIPVSRRTAGATTACRAWCGSTRAQVKDWVDGLLHDQDEGKTEELAYTPEQDHRRRGQRHRHQRPGRRGLSRC